MVMWILLAVIAAAWLIFAAVQDLRTKEVSNWASFSLLAIGIAVRISFSIAKQDWSILLIGLVSAAALAAIAHAFYYAKVFAGGDAKLLQGLGAFIPATSYSSAIVNSAVAVVALMLVGFAWSLLFSIKVSISRKKEFISNWKKMSRMYILVVPLAALLAAISLKINESSLYLTLLLCAAMLAYPYLKAVDRTLISRFKPTELTEGDWLLEDVKVGNKTIKTSVHGLSMKDIQMLKKARKNVLVKEGIPFVPAFLLAYILMVSFFASQGQDFFLELLQAFF